jgi:hypothetical protein
MNSSRRVFPIILLLSHALSMATAFCTQRALVARRNSYWQISPLSQNTNNNIDEDEDDDDNNNDSDINENYPREPRNKMEQFIAAFLDKHEEEDNSDKIFCWLPTTKRHKNLSLIPLVGTTDFLMT